MSQSPRRRRTTKADTALAPGPAPRKPASILSSPPNGAMLGEKLRAEREKQRITVREMARRVGVSPSLVSQIERGLVMPSVGTLWSMATGLGLIIDELFRNTEQSLPASGPIMDSSPERANCPIQRAHNRQRIRLAGGVEWERLTPQADDDIEFLYVKYDPKAESCPEDSLFRHGGKEYAYILSGRLGVQIGFERYELNPGDSLSFKSQIPHRLWAIGDEPAVAIWIVVHRTNDDRNGN